MKSNYIFQIFITFPSRKTCILQLMKLNSKVFCELMLFQKHKSSHRPTLFKYKEHRQLLLNYRSAAPYVKLLKLTSLLQTLCTYIYILLVIIDKIKNNYINIANINKEEEKKYTDAKCFFLLTVYDTCSYFKILLSMILTYLYLRCFYCVFCYVCLIKNYTN